MGLPIPLPICMTEQDPSPEVGSFCVSVSGSLDFRLRLVADDLPKEFSTSSVFCLAERAEDYY